LVASSCLSARARRSCVCEASCADRSFLSDSCRRLVKRAIRHWPRRRNTANDTHEFGDAQVLLLDEVSTRVDLGLGIFELMLRPREVALCALELDAQCRALAVRRVACMPRAALQALERTLQLGDVALAVLGLLPRALSVRTRRGKIRLDGLALVLLLAQDAHDLVCFVAEALRLGLGGAGGLVELRVCKGEVLDLGAEEGRLGRGRLVLDRELGEARLDRREFLWAPAIPSSVRVAVGEPKLADAPP